MTPERLLPFEAKLAQAWPPEHWQSEGVLVAVSGGADSTALLRALVRIGSNPGGRLAAGHFNHRLRGSESDADQAFVETICRQWKVPLEVGGAPPTGLDSSQFGSLEAAARHARYRFLAHTAAAKGLRYVATGHTADDQAETILHRIIRGTGLLGLAGMARARPLGQAVTLIRPLLGFRRQEAGEYLAQLGQPYRVDSSNLKIRWTRNRIRLDLLPRLAAEYNPQVVEALVRLGWLAREAHEVISGLVESLAERCVQPGPNGGVRLDRYALAGVPPFLVRELFIAVWRRQGWPLAEMGFDEWDALARLATDRPAAAWHGGQAAVHVFPGGIRAERVGSDLRIVRQ